MILPTTVVCWDKGNPRGDPKIADSVIILDITVNPEDSLWQKKIEQ